MSPSSDPLQLIAADYADARRTGRRLPLLSARMPGLTLADAEEVARQTTELLASPVVGFKLGYTSAVMREQMGIASPNWGQLTRAMDFAAEASPLLVHPRTEPEVAIVTGRALAGGAASVEEVRAAVRSVHLALEIVDTRYTAYRFTLEDNTADCSSAAGFVLGPAHGVEVVDRLHDAVVLHEDGVERARGHARDAMGGPLLSVQWLVVTLAARGRELPVGSVILTGGLTQALAMTPGTAYMARHPVLGEVEYRWRPQQ
jgi:2-keto-4-pentenoate hydratase